MATADSVKAKLQGLIAKANATTGNQDADLTTAVDALVDGFGSGVTINNQDKTITENGTYTADEGYTGLGTVLVNVASSGGGGDDGSFKGVIERTAVNPTLPSDLTSIGNYAFYSHTNLALTSLPGSLTSIGSNAFYNCTNLAEITFDGKPNSISAKAFISCTNLLTINVPWAEGEVANAPWGATNATINYNYTGG